MTTRGEGDRQPRKGRDSRGAIPPGFPRPVLPHSSATRRPQPAPKTMLDACVTRQGLKGFCSLIVFMLLNNRLVVHMPQPELSRTQELK